ncbi:MAG: L-2-hydroxyglutarate oxidase [Bacteroidia bacterium]|nr:L-2-hydroxyglutarate oxidase [Bacteroidia bacterium]
MIRVDFLIIGGGIIGLSIARELINRFPDKKIALLEKEPDVAYHSSGRNSGVLHAGFYYTADSLKAKFTREGNTQIREYCYENGLKINECKKVVVAKNEAEVETIFELERRGKANGVKVQVIDEKELLEIDPNVLTTQFALYSPTTATVDPVEVNLTIKNELVRKGISLFFSEGYYRSLGSNTIETTKNRIISGEKIINAAGLYADRIAEDFGFSKDYTIIPFKGIYLKYHGEHKTVKTNVYPVPNLKNPFLGVHFTITVDGTVKIGPTSVPALWRENYAGMDNFKLDELIAIFGWEGLLFLTNSFNFRSLTFDEIRKYQKKYFIGLAGKMVHQIDSKGFSEWGRPGIRAQLLNKRTKELVMDFVVEGDHHSVHVLNAVSPAFTCSFPFAKYVVDNYIIN